MNAMTRNKDTYIIVRVYNEASVVRRVVEKILEKYEYVVCVDDGSHDDSVEEILKTKAFLVRHPVNLGAGAALQTGIEFALEDKNAQIFACFDADGQHSLDDLTKMVDMLRHEKLDMVIGSRFMGKTEGMSLFKGLLLKLAIIFSNGTSGVKLTDAHNGLRVFNRHAAETMQLTVPGFGYASEMTERISQNGYTYKEAPVTITYSDYSKAKGQPMLNSVNIAFDLLLNRISKP